MATSMLAKAALDPLTGKADCEATLELIVLLVELIPDAPVLSPLLELVTAAVL